MNQRHVLRIGNRSREIFAGVVQQLMKIECIRRRRETARPDHQHMFQCRQRGAQIGDLAPLVERLGGDQYIALADGQPLMDRLGTESRKQRAKYAAVLQSSQRRDVELGNPSGQNKHPIALADTETAQRIGEAIGQPP